MLLVKMAKLIKMAILWMNKDTSQRRMEIKQIKMGISSLIMEIEWTKMETFTTKMVI